MSVEVPVEEGQHDSTGDIGLAASYACVHRLTSTGYARSYPAIRSSRWTECVAQ